VFGVCIGKEWWDKESSAGVTAQPYQKISLALLLLSLVFALTCDSVVRKQIRAWVLACLSLSIITCADLATANACFGAFLQNHTTAEWVMLEGTSEDHLVHHHLPCSKQGQLLQVAQDHDQLGFDCLQGWRLHNLSGQPVPVFSHPCNKSVSYDVPVHH